MSSQASRPPALERLLAQRPDRYESVPADVEAATRILDRILEEEVLAVMLQSWQARRASLDALHRTAHTLAYDAARKAVDALLLAMGVRVSRDGGHTATVAAAEAILVAPPASRPRNARTFAQARFVRHDDEYSRPEPAAQITVRERRAQTQNLIRLVADCRAMLGLAMTEELIPTDARLDAWVPPASNG